MNFVKNEKVIETDFFHLPKENLTEFDLDEQFKERRKNVAKPNHIRINKNFGSIFDEDAYRKKHNSTNDGEISNFNSSKSIDKIYSDRNTFKTSSIFRPNLAKTDWRYVDTYNTKYQKNQQPVTLENTLYQFNKTNESMALKDMQSEKISKRTDTNFQINNNHIFNRITSPSDIRMNEFLNAKNNLVLKRPLDVSKSDVYNQGSVPFKVLKSNRPNLSQINLQKRKFNFSMTNLRGTHLNLWNDVQQRVLEKNQNHFISSRKNDEIINI